MKKGIMIGLILISGLILTSAVYATGPWGGGGCGSNQASTVDIDAVKKFQKETLSLRDDLIIKQLELQKEYAEAAPDSDKIAVMKKELIDIQTKIRQKAEAAGLPDWGGRMGHRMMGRGMMGGGCGGCGGCGGNQCQTD